MSMDIIARAIATQARQQAEAAQKARFAVLLAQNGGVLPGLPCGVSGVTGGDGYVMIGALRLCF